VIKKREADVTNALEELVGSVPEMYRKRFREVLSLDDYSSSELTQLWLRDEQFLPDDWIRAWETGELTDLPGPYNRHRNK
jgi:hypothetical protein